MLKTHNTWIIWFFYSALTSKPALWVNVIIILFFTDSLSIQPNCTLPRLCICGGALEQTHERTGEMWGSEMKGSQGWREGLLLKQSHPIRLLPWTALSPCITSYHISGIFQSLIFSSCEPIRLLTLLSCLLQRYLGIHYLRSHFSPVCMCVHPENKVPLVLLVWCQGQFLIPFYKAFLLLMQQLVGY